jgi:pyruvate dehydrogenase E2 component (dihydrolipoamide acetyltransferase)
MENDMITVVVPDIGAFKDIPVIEIPVKAGEFVTVDQTLAVLESDKATLDVPAPTAGRIAELKLKVGDRVSAGVPVAVLEAEATTRLRETRSDELMLPSDQVIPERQEVGSVAPADGRGTVPSVNVHASPSVRRLAREMGLDLSKIPGTGLKGRVTKDDLKNFARQDAARAVQKSTVQGLDLLPWPQVDFTKYGTIERVPLSRIRKISGPNLVRNSVVIPHVTNFDEADITTLEEFRVNTNALRGGEAKLTMLAFMIKAAVSALRRHPYLNASLDGDDVVLKQYFHIGFAADTPNGLLVPVVKNADQKGLLEIAAEVAELARRARDGQLKPDEMQGGCFTISSLGGIGGNGFTPLINAPEVAILGAGQAKVKPVWDSSQFVPRLILPLSLSWDHRVLDGAEAARFLVTLTGLLADFRKVSL